MKAVIIDDEKKARNLLRVILTEYCPEISVIEEAPDLPTGVKLIRKIQPDIVFLDIEMPRYLGIQILDFFEQDEINFHIVFTTAYNEYAIKAFQMNAIDYLLKPIRPNQIKAAVIKVSNLLITKDINTQLNELRAAFQSTSFGKIGLPISTGILFVKIDDIMYMKADGMYTHLYIKGQDKITISKPMKFYADLLKDNSFFYRPHRSFLIHIQYIKQLVKKDGPYILMENDGIVSLSREKREEFMEMLENL
ncbi:MAG: two-component system LytT family response regulator [Maribacter sp.]|jgi:two-component system LytT family response regulator